MAKTGQNFVRLVCENCEAEYEIPDDAIPPGGREVRCSNCEHVWFAKPDLSDDADAEANPESAIAKRPGVSEDVRAILREEVAREMQARETTPTPAKPDAAPKPAETNTPPEPVSQSSEPDNTQTPDTPAEQAVAQNTKPRRNGFRFGFVFALTILVALTAAYIFAPELSAYAPQYTDEINTYVLWVNDLRQDIYQFAQWVVNGLTTAINNLTTQSEA